ncbi:MAG TPA: DNA-3-methyladenine glycosylase [Candidatus Acidoferrales bacterium]|nr:DNA-3-methyladenine glycosylase [Candidatus Acidoferrales bacterium]
MIARSLHPQKQKQATRTRAQRIRRLKRSELPVDTIELARFLIGKTLVHSLPQGRLVGRIVETEAYPPGDAAGHAFRGLRPRNQSLFLKRGHAYVHFAYGSCWLINVSSEIRGIGAGVLLRGLEPLQGIAIMRRHNPGAARESDLARGPGRLTTAFGIDKRYDGADLCTSGPLWLGSAPWAPKAIGKSVRIGITRAADRLFRFYERGNPCVSGPARLRS